jgi:5'-nucleotidase (lipoprotein e(P4) family)
MGVEMFSISNRSINQKKETIENLQMLGFPFADETYVLLKEDISGKESRRSIVQESHEIVLFVGDNLSDFSKVFDDQWTEVLNIRVDCLKSYFGKKFIVLPNPMYGDWETKGILEGKYNWTNFQKKILFVVAKLSPIRYLFFFRYFLNVISLPFTCSLNSPLS